MKKVFAVVITLCLFFSMLSTAFAGTRFYDVPESHWAYEYIDSMAQRGIIAGYGNGCFNPDKYVTRGEYAKLLTVTANLPLEELYAMVIDLGAMDVTVSDWYAQYLVTVSEYLEPTEGDNGYLYRPEDYATREEVAVSIIKAKGYDTAYANYNFLNAFKDSFTIKTENLPYMAIAVEKGIITGYDDNTIRGGYFVKRSEIAAILARAYDITGYSDYDYSKILMGDFSDFAGLWKNADGYTINLKPDGSDDYYDIVDDILYDDGYYSWTVSAEEGDSYAIWLYPVGVEVVDLYTGTIVWSDTSKVRLYAGQDFCATPENIYYK